MSKPDPFPSRTRSGIRRKLLAWFDREQRSLPWRANRDPYRIWVSEVMLQQTTVAAVVPYYTQFLNRFPTVYALAEADEQTVLKLWQGLGYYRRARHLHAAAQRIVSEHDGNFPDDPDYWQSLPGIGRYMVGAVLSQAFDHRLPIVEANSLRVLSRLHGSKLDPRTGLGRKWVWEAAEELLPVNRVGDFNQAIMELGALVCTVRNPNCSACPLRTECVANRLGIQAEIPPQPQQKQLREVREVALVIRKRRTVLVGQRPTDAARWPNMWELPSGEVKPGESAETAAERIAVAVLGLQVKVRKELTTLTHRVTRHLITLTAWEATPMGKKVRSKYYSTWEWIGSDEGSEYPMSTPQRKLFEAATS
jgi:A/G-specific adenine glycosylase